MKKYLTHFHSAGLLHLSAPPQPELTYQRFKNNREPTRPNRLVACVFKKMLAMLSLFPINLCAQACHCSDPNAIVIGVPGATTTVTTAIAQGLLAPMPDAFTTSQQVCIRGTLVVDVTYVFATSQLAMDSDASILVSGDEGTKLTIKKGSSVYGCGQPWEDIEVVSLNHLEIISSMVKNATEGVYATSGSSLNLQNNTFLNNDIGLHVNGNVNQPLPMTANTFSKTGTGSYGYAGIKLTNVPGFAIGTTNAGASPNMFQNLTNGIIATESEFNVHNAIFDIPGGSVAVQGDGNAILIEESSVLTASFNRFRRCGAGIFVNNSSLEAHNNVMLGLNIDTDSVSTIGVAV